jgi:hypothetical protein
MSYASWKRYESEERWTSYYTQINEVLGRSPDSVLEIGVGNGIVSDALKRQGIQVQTLDIDPELKPDFVGSVSQIPLADASVDVALCAEVLEHLPFEEFEGCVQELARVSRNGVVLSLPHWGYTFRGVVDIPGLPMLFVRRGSFRFKSQSPWGACIVGRSVEQGIRYRVFSRFLKSRLSSNVNGCLRGCRIIISFD